MKYLSDEELVKSYVNGNKDSFNAIYERYKDTVKYYSRKFFLLGGDSEDIIQEGMKGLFNAVMTYKEESSSFKTYANLCIKSSILTAVKKYSSTKSQALNSSTSIDSLDALGFLSSTPEDFILSKESGSELEKTIYKQLSKTELLVLKCFLSGLSYEEIAEKLGLTAKQVDNALARSRKKIRKCIGV